MNKICMFLKLKQFFLFARKSFRSIIHFLWTLMNLCQHQINNRWHQIRMICQFISSDPSSIHKNSRILFRCRNVHMRPMIDIEGQKVYLIRFLDHTYRKQCVLLIYPYNPKESGLTPFQKCLWSNPDGHLISHTFQNGRSQMT